MPFVHLSLLWSEKVININFFLNGAIGFLLYDRQNVYPENETLKYAFGLFCHFLFAV